MAFSTAKKHKKLYHRGIVFLIVCIFLSPTFVAAQSSTSLPQNFARSIFCTINDLLGIKSCLQSPVLPNPDLVAAVAFIPIEDGPQPQIIQNITHPVIEHTIHTREIIKQVFPEKIATVKTTEKTLAQFSRQLEQLSQNLYQTSSSAFDDTDLWKAIALMNVSGVNAGTGAGSSSSSGDQSLAFNSGTSILTISAGNSVDLSALSGGAGSDDQILSSATYNAGTNEFSISIENGNTVTIDLSDLIDDADASATNEIQSLLLTGNNLSLSGTSTAIDLSAYLDDTTLTELQVDAFVSDNGYLTSEVDGSVLNEIQDLQLSGDSLIITGNGTATTIDLSPYLDNTDTLSDLNCTSNEIAKWNGSAWGCSVDASGTGGTDDQTIDSFSLSANIISLSLEGDGEAVKTIDLTAYVNTDTQLNEAQVDSFVSDNGYLTSETDGSITNEIQVLSLSSNILSLTGTSSPIDLSVYLDDTDTQLNETEVDNYVANNGYLTVEIDDQTIDVFNLVGDILSLSIEGDDEAVKTVDLSTYAKDSALHDAITLSGAFDYLSLVGQDIARSAIDLAFDITGTLSIGNGGTGATTTALARNNLGLAIGANVQAFDSDTSLIGQTIETTEISNGTILAADLNLTDITLADFTNDQSFITDGNSNWDNSYGFITSANDTVSGSELDGVFSASGLLTRTGTGTYSTLVNNSANWNTAFGWGDHSGQGYLTGITGQSIKTLSDVYGSMTPTDGQVLTYDTTNGWQSETLPDGADHLGNHTATQALNLNGNWLSGDGGAEGLFVAGSGNVGIGTTGPSEKLYIDGNLKVTGGINTGTIESSSTNLQLTPTTGESFAIYGMGANALNIFSGGTPADSGSGVTFYGNSASEFASDIKLRSSGNTADKVAWYHADTNKWDWRNVPFYDVADFAVEIGNSSDAGVHVNGYSSSVINIANSANNGMFVQLRDDDGATTHMFRSYGDSYINTGNVGIGTTAPTHPLHMASGAHVTAGGSWTNASSRDLKENFESLNPMEILSSINDLDISQWNYKAEDASILHIGPIAQDFFAEFGLGGSDVSISTIDAAGVALIGIQALSQKFDNLFAGFSLTENGKLIVSDIEADNIKAKTICLGLTCITEDALRDLLDLEPLRETSNLLNDPADNNDFMEEILVEDEEQPSELTAASTSPLSEEADLIEQATSTIEKIIQQDIIGEENQTLDENPIDVSINIPSEPAEEIIEQPLSEDQADETEIFKLQVSEPEPIHQTPLIDNPQAGDNDAALIN